MEGTSAPSGRDELETARVEESLGGGRKSPDTLSGDGTTHESCPSESGERESRSRAALMSSEDELSHAAG